MNGQLKYLYTASDVLVNVNESEHARAPESESKILNWSVYRKTRIGIFIVGLQVIHREL